MSRIRTAGVQKLAVAPTLTAAANQELVQPHMHVTWLAATIDVEATVRSRTTWHELLQHVPNDI